MTSDRAGKALYPTHDWGRMASDPFMTVGREDTEARDMLKRMWTRSGGDPVDFDALIPLDGPYGRKPDPALYDETE